MLFINGFNQLQMPNICLTVEDGAKLEISHIKLVNVTNHEYLY